MNPLNLTQGIYKIALTPPEPIQQNKKWWEFLEYRPKRSGETAIDGNGHYICHAVTPFPVWIASPIPEPTPEQLKAIGMTCPAGRPTEVKEGNVIWTDGGQGQKVCPDVDCEYNVIGHHRFVLSPMEKQPIPPPEVHYDCFGCRDIRFMSEIKIGGYSNTGDLNTGHRNTENYSQRRQHEK